MSKQATSEHAANRRSINVDEWSGDPIEIQQYIEQMLRSLFSSLPQADSSPGPNLSQDQNSHPRDKGDYIGLEMGAERFPWLDSDEFELITASSKAEQTERSVNPFKTILFQPSTAGAARPGE